MIISFYSYKGGTGRSLCLCNVAAELAKRGNNVGCVDLDIEAPGLSIIFDLHPKETDLKRNIFDLILHKSLTGIEDSVVELSQALKLKKGQLSLLPCVRDPHKADQIEWDDETLFFLKELLDTYRKYYKLDYLLIDTRTGISYVSAFCLQCAGLSIVFSRPNRQNIIGCMEVKKILAVHGADCHFVLSDVPGMAVTRKFLDKFKGKVKTDDFDFMIPHDPLLALEERLIVLDKPTAPAAKAYVQLVDSLTR